MIMINPLKKNIIKKKKNSTYELKNNNILYKYYIFNNSKYEKNEI